MAEGAGAAESPAAAARHAVSALSAHGASIQVRLEALHALVLLLRAPSSQDVTAAAETALDAGVLPLLAASLRATAEAASKASFAGSASAQTVEKLCGAICGAVGELSQSAGKARGLTAPAWAAVWRDTAFPSAQALVVLGAKSAMVADYACCTLGLLLVHGLLPDGAAAALAARGAAEALRAHAPGEYRVGYHAALLTHALLLPRVGWPARRCERAAAAFRAAGGIVAICDALETHHGVSDAAEELLSTILLLPDCDRRAALLLLRAGVVGAVLQTLRSQPRNTAVARTACAVLDLLSRPHPHEVADAVSAADGWRVLVAVLRQHGSNDLSLAKNTTGLFATAAQQRATCMAAAAAGAIPSITAAMRAHFGYMVFQEHGMMALHHFAATCSGKLADLLLAARASAAVAAAMARHSAPEVQRAGFLALESMCHFSDTPLDQEAMEAQQRAACAAVAADAPVAVLAALRANSGNGRLRSLAPAVLVGLLQANTWPPDGVVWSQTRAALVDLIVEHGCPVDNEGVRDVIMLSKAVQSLLEDDSQPPGHAPPPRLAEAMCVTLRVAAEMRTKVPGAGWLTNLSLVVYAGRVIEEQAEVPGPAGAAFAAEAVACHAIELLVASAAHCARRKGGEPMFVRSLPSSSALCAVAKLANRSPAAACLSAACAAHTLVGACRRAGTFAHVDASCVSDMAAMARHLRALAAVHKSDGICSVPDCPLLVMNRLRCCLRGCADADAPVKRCAECRCAAYCSKLHQRQAWKQHKPVCAVRKAAKQAAAALDAQEDA